MAAFRQFALTHAQHPLPIVGSRETQLHERGGGMKAQLKRFAAGDGATTAIEYGLLAAGIAVAMVTSVNQLGCDLVNLFGRVDSSLQGQ
jgi:pilus assembly protein Flp/PilA